MQWIIKKTLLASCTLLALGSSFAQAAPKPSPPVAHTQAALPIDCANQALLENLTALIVKSNQLDTSLNFQFSQVRLGDLDTVKATALDKSKSCVAHVQIMRGQSREVLDELDVSYSVVANSDGTVGLTFKPIRQTPQ